MRRKTAAWCGFLIGLGSKTQIFLFGCIGISELVLFLIAPFVLLRKLNELKRDGFLPVLSLFILAMVGCLISSRYNHAQFVATYKTFAQVYATFAAVIVFHSLLKSNVQSVGLYVLGYAISSIITIWAFHPRADIEIGYLGMQTSEDMMGSVMFWIKKVRELAVVPVCLWYFKTPLAYSVSMPIAYSIYAMLASSSGRSMALSTMGASALTFLGRKSRTRMRKISKNLWVILLVLFGMLFVFRASYKAAALGGILGEEARNKYVAQTSQGDGFLKILMSGRKEFFISLGACLDHPIIGLGPNPVDKDGYVYNYLQKYGTRSEFFYYKNEIHPFFRLPIPCHSYITSFWLWFGVFGLTFWIYVAWMAFRYFRYNVSAVPQLFGFFSLFIPTLLWDMFFSPYGWRLNNGLIIAALVFVDSVSRGRILLPFETETEAQAYDR